MKKNRRFFARRRQKRKNFAIFRRFRLNLGVFNASAEGASEKFRVFYRGTAHDVITFKFQGGIRPPPCSPLLTPMGAGDVCLVAWLPSEPASVYPTLDFARSRISIWRCLSRRTTTCVLKMRRKLHVWHQTRTQPWNVKLTCVHPRPGRSSVGLLLDCCTRSISPQTTYVYQSDDVTTADWCEYRQSRYRFSVWNVMTTVMARWSKALKRFASSTVDGGQALVWLWV